MPPRIEELPYLVLARIVDHLNSTDRLAFGLVCKKFFQITNQKKFLGMLIFKNNFFSDGKLPPTDFTRSFSQFKFDGVVFDEQAIKYLEKLKSRMSSLVFKYCTFTRIINLDLFCNLQSLSLTMFAPDFELFEGVTLQNMVKMQVSKVYFRYTKFVELCNAMPNLQVLLISKCVLYEHAQSGRTDIQLWDLLSVKSFINLKELSLKKISLSYCEVLKICYKAPNLRKLSIMECSLYADETELGKISIDPNTWRQCFIRIRSTLKQLCFPYTEINSSVLLAIAKIPGLRLEELSLKRGYQQPHWDSDFQEIFSRQRNLASLDLAFRELGDEQVIDLCECLPGLQKLDLSGCRELSKPALMLIFQLKCLQKLNLGRLGMANFAQLFQDASQFQPASYLVSLTGCLTDLDVAILCIHHPNLQELHAQDSKKLTDVSAMKIFQLKNLKNLNLGNCTGITLKGFSKAFRNSRCFDLEILDLTYCDINDKFVYGVCRKYRSLKKLFLNCCQKTTKHLERTIKYLGPSYIRCNSSSYSLRRNYHLAAVIAFYVFMFLIYLLN